MTAEHAHGIDTGGEWYETPGDAEYPDVIFDDVPVAVDWWWTPKGRADHDATTRASAADAVLTEARRLCCGNNPTAHHEATAKHSELMAFAGRLAGAVRGA